MVITTGSTCLAFAASFAFAIDAVARTRFGRAGARSLAGFESCALSPASCWNSIAPTPTKRAVVRLERVATHKAREAGVILEGQLEMWIGGECFLLRQGDSYTFLSSTPHWSRNPGNTETRFVWVVTPA